MTTWRRLVATGVVVVASGLLSGCVTTVGGSAQRDPGAPRPETTLTEADLDDVLLPPDELDDIMGTSGLEVSADLDDLVDSFDAVSDVDCVGAAFGAQEVVFGELATAVRDQILREPGDDNASWLEQVVVLYSTSEDARDVFDAARATWDSCVGSLVTYDANATPLEWTVDEVTAEGSTISQMSTPEDARSGGCHHAMSVVSNVVVEAWACSDSVVDEGTAITGEMVANIENN
ncbi:sensor domain-containing protein [Mycobacterium sp. NPDC004974]